MRNLTVKRTKSFVGSLMKVKVYVEDPAAAEITISETPCRKLGELKNGEEKTFQIGEQAAKVFVIADKVSKEYCNDHYQLFDGQDDVFLSGKNMFNPANGNAFRFDSNETIEVLKSRKHGTKIGLIVLITAMVVGGVFGFLAGFGLFPKEKPKEKTFSSNGISMTLTNEFKEVSFEKYTAAFDSKNVAVFALKEAFTLKADLKNNTPEQYADLVIQANGLADAEKRSDNGQTYFEYEYTNPETNDTYRFFCYVYKTDDAFWTVQFTTLNRNVEKYTSQIENWARSVRFDN